MIRGRRTHLPEQHPAVSQTYRADQERAGMNAPGTGRQIGLRVQDPAPILVTGLPSTFITTRPTNGGMPKVMSWVPGFPEAFTSVSGGRSRLADLHIAIAAALTAQALNIGYTPLSSRAANYSKGGSPASWPGAAYRTPSTLATPGALDEAEQETTQ